MFLEGLLADAGCEVVGPVSRIEAGIQMARHEPMLDVALLDVNLGRGLVFPIAEELARRNVPIIFMTGYGGLGIPEEFQHCQVVTKPYTEPMVLNALCNLFSCEQQLQTLVG